MPAGLYIRTPEILERMRNSHLGNFPSLETRIKMGVAHKGKAPGPMTDEWRANISKGQKGNMPKGSAHYLWKKDRTLLKDDSKDRKGQLHREWSRSVKKRDNWKCKIANQDCNGRLEAHHILGWKTYPELRYIINNGITLCHAHHPRKRSEEQKLAPVFQELIKE